MTKRYGDHVALDGVDLDIAPGEICGLLGPNGAGKTTLVSIIAGLRGADRGTVTVDGLDVATDRRTRGLVGLAGQETAIYPTLKVRANLELMGGLAGMSKREVRRRIGEIAEVLELDDLLDRKARFLSGGEKRRLHTAMAMLHRPRLLMLDEPTTGVDIATRARLLTSIRELARQEGCAVLYSTHYLPEIEDLGATVAILDGGRMLARGPLDELVEQHGTGMVELVFEGDPPDRHLLERLLGPRPLTVIGPVVRTPSERPGADAAVLLAALGELAGTLASVELIRPSLEAVFLGVTGRAYAPGDETSDAETTDARKVDEVRS
ncbi:MAG: ABC transporter ATP-binding protein [Actinobacteria bacterium]|nr:ABC transporter ATP-binding protein [Actinomycetota bacterium]